MKFTGEKEEIYYEILPEKINDVWIYKIEIRHNSNKIVTCKYESGLVVMEFSDATIPHSKFYHVIDFCNQFEKFITGI